jgi:hypothetical protein
VIRDPASGDIRSARRPRPETTPGSGRGHDAVEPTQQVALDLVAVRLVEHLVPGTGIDAQFDVAEPAVAREFARWS